MIFSLPDLLMAGNAAVGTEATVPVPADPATINPRKEPQHELGELDPALQATTTDPVMVKDLLHSSNETNPLDPFSTQTEEQSGLQYVPSESMKESVSNGHAPASDHMAGVLMENSGDWAHDIDRKQQEIPEPVPAKLIMARDSVASSSPSGSLQPATSSDAEEDVDSKNFSRPIDSSMRSTPLVANPEEAEFEIDSSPIESSSSDSSSGSPSSEDSDDDYELLDPEEQARRLMQEDGDGGSDEESGKKGTAHGPLRTLNEIPDEDVTIPDVKITPEMNLEELGCVETVVGNVILVKGKVSGEYRVLETGSVICLEGRVVIGVIAETLGRVQQPLYSVRFRNAAAIAEAGISKFSRIYYVEHFSTFVFTQTLKVFKGSDASNIYDEEVGDDEMEFSDDEAEAAYKKSKNQQKHARRQERMAPSRSTSHTSNKNEPYKNMNEQATELDYDDSGTAIKMESSGDSDLLYTPLARPSNLHVMLTPRLMTSEARRGQGQSSRGGARGRGSRNRGQGNHRDRYSNGSNGAFQSHQRPDAYSPTTQSSPMSNPASANAVPTVSRAGLQSPHAHTFNHSQNPLNHQTYQAQSSQPYQPYDSSRISQQRQYQPTYNPPPQMQQYQQPYSPSYPVQGQYPQQYAAYPSFPPSPSSAIPPGAFVNPAFFNISYQAPAANGLPQSSTEPGLDLAFKAAQDRLDLLRQLSQASAPPS